MLTLPLRNGLSMSHCGVLAVCCFIGLPTIAVHAATQNVFLDFDTGTSRGEHVYTLAHRNTILAALEEDFAPWDFAFSHTTEFPEPSVLVRFNDGLNEGGRASDLDFRNLDLDGFATVDVDRILGCDGCPPNTEDNIVALSASVAAHEVGHLAGLKHLDALGPIGFGLGPAGPDPIDLLPFYAGPVAAVETTQHIMASPFTVGQTLDESITDLHFGERAALKLEFAQVGFVSQESSAPNDTPATAQRLSLPSYEFPNTLRQGDLNFGKRLFAEAEAVVATIDIDDVDFYAFDGEQGDIINVEVLSDSIDRLTEKINPEVLMISPDMITPVIFGNRAAQSSNDLDTTDAFLLDIELPVTGTFYLEVKSARRSDMGDYELFAYRFRPTPEPSTLGLAALAGMLLSCRRRR